MTSPRSPISQRQNDPDMRTLLRAAFAAHARGQRLETLRIGVSLISAAAGLLAAFVTSTATSVTIVGALWAVGYAAAISPWTKRLARRSATIQEMFDVDLFGLPWNHTAAGAQLAPFEISQLARRFTPGRRREEQLRDWYVDTRGVPQPYDILLCQQQNLGWDARLRRRWSWLLLGAVVTWTLLGLLIGSLASLTVTETATRWYLPALAALLYGIESYRAQRDIAAERERIIPMVQTEIDHAQRPPLPPAEHQRLVQLAREVQDIILATRKQPARVPQWFYAHFRDADEQDFQANAERLRNTFAEMECGHDETT